MKTSKLRVAVPLIILAIASIAYIVHFDFGTLSSFGWSTISLICPLGALSTLLATKTVVPRVVIALVAGLVMIIVFGRAFCAWICPVPVVSKLRNLFSSGKKAEDDAKLSEGSSAIESLTEKESKALENGCGVCGRKRGNTLDSRHIILGGSLLTAVVFGFPVLCLVCPIGLSFATVFLIINLFGAGDMTWAVVVVPLILLAEVVFFRKWCTQFCPLSALMSLASKAGRFFRPKINDGRCLESSAGKSCGVCGEVCPEKIDPRHPELSPTDTSECTKCRICVEKCPANAIKLAVWAQKIDDSKEQLEDNR